VTKLWDYIPPAIVLKNIFGTGHYCTQNSIAHAVGFLENNIWYVVVLVVVVIIIIFHTYLVGCTSVTVISIVIFNTVITFGILLTFFGVRVLLTTEPRIPQVTFKLLATRSSASVSLWVPHTGNELTLRL